MNKNTKIFLFILILLLIGCSSYFLFRQKKKDNSNEKELITNFTEGITLIEENGGKILRDENEKFELKIKEEWKLSQSTNILEIITEENKFNGELQKSFFILKGDLFENNFEDEINRWVNLQNSICPNCYNVESYIFLDNLKIAVVRDNVAINDQKDFLFIKNKYLYGISTINMSLEEVKAIITNIKFLN